MTPYLPPDGRRPPFRFDPPPADVDARLHGSAALLRALPSLFPDRELPPRTVVALLLDRRSLLVAQARLRVDAGSLDDLPVGDRASLLARILRGLRTADPRGAVAAACLLVVLRRGDARIADGDVRWWTGLTIACRAHGLHAADVLVSTPDGWFTVRAGTRGPEPWPATEPGRPWVRPP